MLTGSRVGEVRLARFEQFSLELGSWSKPAASTKQRKVHRIPISAEVAAIVRSAKLPNSSQRIACAANRAQNVVAAVSAKRFAQAPYMDIDSTRFHVDITPPNLVKQLLAA